MTGGELRTFALFVLVVSAGVSVWLAWWAAPSRRVPGVRHALAMFGVALVLRGVLSICLDGGIYDVFGCYRLVGDQLRQGADAFVEPALDRQNYFPLLIWWWAGATAIAPHGSPHLFATVVRLPFWITDAAIAPALLLVLRGPGRLRAAWLYAVNPVTMAVATLHGQADAMVVMPMVAAVALRRYHPSTSAMLYGLAVLIKPWPLFFLPALLRSPPGRGWPRYVALVAIPPAVSLAAYASVHPHHITNGILRVLTYSASPQGLGTAPVASVVASSGWLLAGNVAAGMVVLCLAWRSGRSRQIPAEAVALGMLVLLTLSPTTGDQYLMWPIAFLLLAGRLRLAMAVTLGMLPATMFLDLVVSNGAGPIVPGYGILLAGATVSLGVAAARLLRFPTVEEVDDEDTESSLVGRRWTFEQVHEHVGREH